eukprot:7259927-Pyramimonas_sp.AAC.1
MEHRRKTTKTTTTTTKTTTTTTTSTPGRERSTNGQPVIDRDTGEQRTRPWGLGRFGSKGRTAVFVLFIEDLDSIVQCGTVQCSIVQYSAVQCSAVRPADGAPLRHPEPEELQNAI